MSNATGKLSVVPVCNFDQSDLCADDVMLLDTFTSVLVWVGAAANETERAQVRLLFVWGVPIVTRSILIFSWRNQYGTVCRWVRAFS